MKPIAKNSSTPSYTVPKEFDDSRTINGISFLTWCRQAGWQPGFQARCKWVDGENPKTYKAF
jgi:hypothetical protein